MHQFAWLILCQSPSITPSTHHPSLRGISFNGQWPCDILECEKEDHNHHVKKPSLANTNHGNRKQNTKDGNNFNAFVNSMDFKQCNVVQWVYQPCRRKAPEDLESGPFHLGGKVPRVQAVQVKINRALTRKIQDNWTTYQIIIIFIEKNLQSTESPNRAMAPFGVCDCHKPCKEWSARLPLGLALAHTMAIPMASMTKPCGVLQAMRFWKKPCSLIRL